ncbi:TetR/AcrR family transcriptional regulator [Bacillus sp. FJAT-47783]|uniref:TetR/AcrR family transcriptional regulator n=1 Tax=Bacillus sp. FJAT-47783 TaxID=2922712 RepID=UPI001FABB2AA
MDGYQKRTEKKKDSIRNAAMELFSEFGFEKVTVAEIAKKANVSPVTIYNYFGNKDDLVKHVISHSLNEAINERKAVIESNIPFPDKIKNLIFEKAAYIETVDPDFLQKLMSNDPEIKKIVDEMYQKAMPLLVQLFEEGKREGYIDETISTETLLMYVNMFKHAGNQYQLFDSPEKNAQITKEIGQLFFYGLLKKK